MWKAVLFVAVLFVAGHFAVRYIRTNPLSPVIESGEVVVETNEYEVRLSREGPVEGTYLVEAAKTQDWSNEPANVVLSVIDFAETRDYMRAYPDFHRYGSIPGLKLENVSAPLSLIAANRLAYGELRNLVDLYEDRVHDHGERLCLTLSGEMVRVASAQSLADGIDHTQSFALREDERRRVFADRVSVQDCVALTAGRR